MPRLESLAKNPDGQECPSYVEMLQPLREAEAEAEAEYNRERDAYLASQA